MSGLAYLSSPFVSVIFGNQWTLTAEILKWLAPAAIIQAISSSTGQFFSLPRVALIYYSNYEHFGYFSICPLFLIGVNFDIITFSVVFIANVLNFFLQ
ncbi:hypothetical protein MJ576_17345 [Klebsiella pneumoniae]|nr:hypothetical protein MJ576_17345 [Klebsiella pneumoniae]